MKYEFHPNAEAEFIESVGFYESPKQRKIEQKPDIRRAPLRRFSFSIIYREKQSVIQVLAVAHDRRRPLYWLPRL